MEEEEEEEEKEQDKEQEKAMEKILKSRSFAPGGIFSAKPNILRQLSKKAQQYGL